MPKGTRLNLRISDEFRTDLERLADFHGLTLSSYAHSLLIKAVRREKETTPDAIETSFKAGDDPMSIMREMLAAEGLTMPRDVGVLLFGGWETFSPEQKRDALVDAKRVIGRKLEQKPKGKVIARIQPGSKMSKTEVRRMLESDVVKPIKRKAR